jgi:aspartyl-tRNA(Asn)/glutamyl-tRNA(Gln) amidotransferase subunit B
MAGPVTTRAPKLVCGAWAANGSGARGGGAERLGVIQVADAGALAGWIDEVLAGHPTEVARYRKGETKLLPFFVGQVMKASKGKADPTRVPTLVKERLGG